MAMTEQPQAGQAHLTSLCFYSLGTLVWDWEGQLGLGLGTIMLGSVCLPMGRFLAKNLQG